MKKASFWLAVVETQFRIHPVYHDFEICQGVAAVPLMRA
jgi:hypothetical protein